MMKLRWEEFFIYLTSSFHKITKLASETSINQRTIPVKQGQNKGDCLKTEVQKTKGQLPTCNSNNNYNNNNSNNNQI